MNDKNKHIQYPAIAWHKMIFDKEGNPSDFVFIEVNEEFERFTGIHAQKVINQTAQSINPRLNIYREHLMNLYPELISSGRNREFTYFSDFLDKWVKVRLSSPQNGYFITEFSEDEEENFKHKVALQKLLSISERFLQKSDDHIDYKAFTDDVIALTQARFALLNIYSAESKSFSTVAVSPEQSDLKVINEVLGLELYAQKFSVSKALLRLILSSSLLQFRSLEEFGANFFDNGLIRELQQTLQLGKVLVFRISLENRLLGTICLVLKENQDFFADDIIKIYARQVAMQLTRYRSELQRVKAGRELMFERNFARTVMKSVNQGLTLIDENGKFYFANQAAAHLLGYEVHEILDKSPEVFTHPEDKQHIRLLFQNKTKGNTISQHIRLINKAGETLFALVSSIPIIQDGVFKGILSTAIDFTEIKKKEETIELQKKQLRQIIDLVPSYIFAKNENGQFLLANKAVAEVFNDHPDNIPGKTELDYGVSEELNRQYTQIDKQVIQRGKALEIPEERKLRKDGSMGWFQTLKIPFVSPDTKKACVLGVATDITERKQIESQLLKSKERAEKQRKAIIDIATADFMISGDLSPALDKITKKICDVIEVKRASIWFFSEDGSLLHPIRIFSNQNNDFVEASYISTGDYPRYFEALKSENSLFSDDVNEDPRTNEFSETYFKQFGITAMLDAGILVEGKLMGVVCCEHGGSKRKWFPEEESFVSTMASLFAQLIVNNKKRKAERNLQKQLQLQEMSVRFSSDLVNVNFDNFDEKLELLFQEVGNNTGLDHIAYFSICNKNKHISLTHEWFSDHSESYTAKFQHYPFKLFPYLKKRILDKNSLMFNELDDLPKGAFAEKEVWATMGIKSLIVLPVIHRAGVIAFLSFGAVNNHFTWHNYWIDFFKVFSNILSETQEKLLNEQLLIKSEQKYRSLVEQSTEMVFLHDLQGHFLEVNKAAEKHTLYTREELLTMSVIDLHVDEVSQDQLEEMWCRMKTGEPIILDVRYKNKQGDAFPVRVKTGKIEFGGQEYIMALIHDISDLKEKEKLQVEVELAQKSLQFKQNFLASMSHEIRTPLTGVMGIIDLLGNTELNSLQKEFVNTLKYSSENLKEIINQVLDYSKIEAGKIRLNKSNFLLTKIVDHTRRLFQGVCYKDIQFKTYLDPQLPEYIYADEKRITQVINNLIINAVKFTEKGFVELRLELEEYLSSSDFILKISVKDTGIGIRKEKHEFMFAPFSQVHHIDTHKYEGTGLGLAICKELSLLQGGDIFLESEPERGSTFWFTIKAKTSIFPDNPKEKEDEISPIPNLNILFVEDKAITRKVIKLLLEAEGHKVSLAENGQHAIEVYKPDLFDVILMDVQMPVMDGVTATNLLKQQYTALPPVIGLSANAFEGDREKFMSLGMDGYLTKPLVYDDFIKEIHSLL